MSAELNMKGAARGAITGGIVAGVIGVVLYLVAAAMGAGFHPKDPAAMGGLDTLPPFQPLVVCVIAALVSVGVLAVLKRLAPARAWTIYLAIAALVFLVEFYLPFWAFDETKTIVALEVMHLPATFGIVGGIKRFGFVTPS